MTGYFHLTRQHARRSFLAFVSVGLLGTLALRPAPAQTYISAEPIPSVDVVGDANLNTILGIGYQNLELWHSAF